MNRKLNMRLFNIKQSVNTTANDEISMKLQLKKEKQKEVYNRKAKDLPIIPTGATVRIHDGKAWSGKTLVTGNLECPDFTKLRPNLEEFYSEIDSSFSCLKSPSSPQ